MTVARIVIYLVLPVNQSPGPCRVSMLFLVTCMSASCSHPLTTGSLPRGGRRWVARAGFVTAERDCGVVRADGTEERERRT